MNEISLTESLQQTLFRIPLFEGAPESLRASLTERLDARLYALEKNEIVAHQGTVCRAYFTCYSKGVCEPTSSMNGAIG